MPVNIYTSMNVYELNEENLAILLKYNTYKSLFLVWGGSIKINKNTNEKPLKLNIHNKNIYFYSNGLEEVSNEKLKNPLIDSKTNNEYQLSITEQKAVVNAFGDLANQKDPQQKIISLELQNEYLNKENDDLKKTNSVLMKEKHDYDSELDLLCKTNDSLIKAIKFFKKNDAELSKVKQLNEMFKWEIERLTNENKDLKEENQLLHNLIKEKEEKTKSFEQKIELYEKNNEKLKKDTKEIANDITKLEREYKKQMIEEPELEWDNFDNSLEI